jgi:hypothetical protein
MLLEILRYVVLTVSAILAGLVNSIAGGGTLLTFPALLSFGALGAVFANATSTMAVMPGSLSGAWGYRNELNDAGWWLRLLAVPSVLGGIVGSLLVTRLPERTFDLLVPWLLLLASLLFLVQPLLSKQFKPREEGTRPSVAACSLLIVFQFLVAVYGGYFGAGIGILMISSLSFMGVGDIHRINALKTILAGAINGISAVIFIVDQKVVWNLALPMALGAILGGYLGAVVGKRLPKAVVRWFVILVGLTLAGYYFVKQI